MNSGAKVFQGKEECIWVEWETIEKEEGNQTDRIQYYYSLILASSRFHSSRIEGEWKRRSTSCPVKQCLRMQYKTDKKTWLDSLLFSLLCFSWLLLQETRKSIREQKENLKKKSRRWKLLFINMSLQLSFKRVWKKNGRSSSTRITSGGEESPVEQQHNTNIRKNRRRMTWGLNNRFVCMSLPFALLFAQRKGNGSLENLISRLVFFLE